MIMQGLGSSYGTMDPMNYHWLGNLSTYATEIMKKKRKRNRRNDRYSFKLKIT